MLEGQSSPDTLTAEEQAVWFDTFHDELAELSDRLDVETAYARLGEDAEKPLR